MCITAIVVLATPPQPSRWRKRSRPAAAGDCVASTEERWPTAWRTDIAIFPPPAPRILVNCGQPEDAFKLAGHPLLWRCGPIGKHHRQSDQVHRCLANLSGSATLSSAPRLPKAHRRPPPSSGLLSTCSARAMAPPGCAFYPRPVILRFSFPRAMNTRSAVRRRLRAPRKEKPDDRLAWRPPVIVRAAFRLGSVCPGMCGLRHVREDMGLSNLIPMISFCQRRGEVTGFAGEMPRHGPQAGP